MVQRTGFEPAKHYALGPHPSPFDHSGTPALRLARCPLYIIMAKQQVHDYNHSSNSISLP
jgi:hypothetical protein